MATTMSDKRFAQLVSNLREISGGSLVEGRWIDQVNYEAVGHDPDAPDDGFYDEQHPPEGYDHGGWVGTGAEGEVQPDEPLIPAEWEEYTLSEQSNWLSTCARLAQDTLAMLGEPVTTEETR